MLSVDKRRVYLQEFWDARRIEKAKSVEELRDFFLDEVSR